MNTLEFINKLEDKSLGAVRAALYNLSIKTGYDKEGRMILFPETRGTNVIGKINNECNGLILYNPHWADEKNESKIRCLAVPMPYLRNSNQMKSQSIILEWNETTQVFPCREGTNIVLYYFLSDGEKKGRWCISTSKGIEVNNLRWNNKTYQEMFLESKNSEFVNQEKNNQTFEEICQNLDSGYSYCFGFNHSDFHVLNDHNSLWLNRVVNLSNFKDDKELYSKSCYELTVPIDFKNATSEEILNILNKTCDNENNRQLTNNLDENKYNKCLGYIIRNLTNGDVLIESELQRTINNLYYHISYTKSIAKTSYVRHNYVLLCNYFNGNKEIFIETFPKFRSIFEYFDSEIELLVTCLETLYRKSKQKQEHKFGHNKYFKIAGEIKKNIDNLIKINVDDKMFHITIMTVLFHPTNFDALYRLLFSSTL